MALKWSIGLNGIRYQGGINMLSWRLHRWSGIGIVLFVALHMLASLSTQVFGSSALADTINSIYMSVYFQILVIFVVYFHALHGLRVILLDFWPRFLEYQKEITWAQWLIFIPLFSLTALIMLMIHLSGSEAKLNKRSDVTMSARTAPRIGFSLEYILWIFVRISGLFMILFALIGIVNR